MYSSKSYSELAKSFAGEKTGFLAEKEKYADRDRELPARFKGKQLIVPGPKKANGTTIGYFNPFTYTAETFVDRNMYVKTQPLESRKLGFGSRNAKVRDEFMSHIRTEQYREQLKSEVKATTTSAAGSGSTSALVSAGDSITGPVSPIRFPKRSGFDVMRDDRSPRSVYNIRGIKKGDRDLGSATLSSQEFGAGLDTAPLSKSEFARDSTCDQFYSNVHL